jgi:hypothetical protein
MAVALLIALLSWFTLSAIIGLRIGAFLRRRDERHHGDGSQVEIREIASIAAMGAERPAAARR